MRREDLNLFGKPGDVRALASRTVLPGSREYIPVCVGQKSRCFSKRGFIGFQQAARGPEIPRSDYCMRGDKRRVEIGNLTWWL
jgi:hypothetical protein